MAFGDQWKNKKYPHGCRGCGQTRTKHIGHGLCQNCYRKPELLEAAKNGTLDMVAKEETATDTVGVVGGDLLGSETDSDTATETDQEEVAFTTPGERRPGSFGTTVSEPKSDVPPASKLGGFFSKKTKPTEKPFATREKTPKPAGRRVSTAGTLEDLWAGLGGVAVRTGSFAPLGRYLQWQSPAAGELLDQALAGTVIDRKLLQPGVKARGRFDVLGAILGPPALIVAIQRNPERAEMLIPALKSAIRGSLPTLLPAMKKAQARETKVNDAVREFFPELPEGVDPVDVVIEQLFYGYVWQEPATNVEYETPTESTTGVA